MKLLLTSLMIVGSMSAFAAPGNGIPEGFEEKLQRSLETDEKLNEFVSKMEKALDTKCVPDFLGAGHGITLWDGGRGSAVYDCADKKIKLKVTLRMKATDLSGGSLRPLRNVRHIDDVKINFKIRSSVLRFKDAKFKF